MHGALQHVLAPFLAAVLGSMVAVDLNVLAWAPWSQWLLWTAVAFVVMTGWWSARKSLTPWHTLALTAVLSVAFAFWFIPLYVQGDATTRAWMAGFGLFVAGTGAYALSPYLPAAGLWVAALVVPAMVLVRDQAVFLGVAGAVWFVVCWLRSRSLQGFATSWEALMVRDPLTNLEKEKAFEVKVSMILGQGDDSEAYLGVVSFDRLRELNHALGYAYGDRIVQAVAARIVGLLRPQESATRISGSQIAMVLVGGRSRVDAFVRQLRLNYPVAGQITQVILSSGWAPFPDQPLSYSCWLDQARTALDAAWDHGGSEHRFYDRSLKDRLNQHRRYSEGLERALVNQEFFLMFQPQFDPDSLRAVGAEALVRWRHPEDGVVGPGDFIPLAEETGLISALGAWILDEALATARNWPPSWQIAVNVSAHQLKDPGFPRRVWSSLTSHGVDPSRLTLEITESVLVNDGDRVKEVLQAFRSGGIRISLDDFGTGYSSLLYLRNFPLDELKVDQAFVRALEGHQESLTIVATILQLATDLGMSATAEGIENLAQATILKRFGCGTFQGYYYSPPVLDPLVFCNK
jgi:diguanylate cyclase (GGDEF)-like protein